MGMGYDGFIRNGIKDLGNRISRDSPISIKDMADLYVDAYSRGINATDTEKKEIRRGNPLNIVRRDLGKKFIEDIAKSLLEK